MTDGVLTAKVRWEGNLTEGKAVVLLATDKTLVSEDMTRMKALMGYKSQETLGLVKGKARVDENTAFADVWAKTRKLMTESEEIEGQDAEKEAPFEEADINHAPEAKKHVQGSVPQTDLGGTAPNPKTGEWEKINVKQAAEAKKHVEGSVAQTDLGGVAPKPKEGNWEEVKKKSSDATAHVESGKPTNMATDKAKVVKEGVEDEEEDEVEDTFYKADDDDSGEEVEPTAKDVTGDVPSLDSDDDDDSVKVPAPPTNKWAGATIMFSPSKGEYWLKHKDAMTKVPDEYLEIAANKDIKASERAESILAKMQAAADAAPDDEFGGEEEIDEYGDEHHISTADAVAGMKPGAVKEYGDEHPISTADAVKNMGLKK
jgi:hypothetical protein